MGTWVRGLGWWDEDDEYGSLTKRAILPTSTGSFVAFIPDGNTPEAFALADPEFVPNPGDGTDVDKIWVFEISSTFQTVTQVASFSTGQLVMPYDECTADLYSDNSVGIVYRLADGTLRFRKITYGTWAVGAAETIATQAGGVEFDRVDLAVTATNVPVVTVLCRDTDSDPRLFVRTYVRRTSDNTWFLANSTTIITSGTIKRPYGDVTLAALEGTATARRVVIAACGGVNQSTDTGARVYTALINESTGALSSMTLRQTYLAGDMSNTIEYWMPRRIYLFHSGTDEVTLGYMQISEKKTLMVARGTWNGTTWTEVIPPSTRTMDFNTMEVQRRCTMTYAQDTVVFFAHHTFSQAPVVVNYIARINDSTGAVSWNGTHFKWDGLPANNVPRVFAQGGTGRNANIATDHATLIYEEFAGGAWHVEAHHVQAAAQPIEVIPSDGASLITSTPNLAVKARLDKAWPQSLHKQVWQFASDTNFTTNIHTYTQPDSKFIRLEGTEEIQDTQGNPIYKYVLVSDTLPSSEEIGQGTWYLRAATIDEFGKQGPWSATQTVTVGHAPSAYNLSPNSGNRYNPGTGVQFTWAVTDPSPTDYQTAYQVIVERDDTMAVIHDSGKVVSQSSSHVASIAVQDVQLNWKVRVWDVDDVVGPYTDYETFELTSSPTVVIDSVGSAGTLNSSVPQVVFTPTVSGIRRIKKYQAVFSQSGSNVWDSGQISIDVASGTQITYTGNSPVLVNSSSYSVIVYVWDDMNLEGQSPLTPFSTSWTAPPTPTGVSADASFYGTEGLGYVALYWNDTQRDNDYAGWIVYRRDDLLNSTGGVAEVGEWVEVDRVYDVASTYEYHDYTAPSSYKCTYRITQLVNRFGHITESNTSSEVIVYPDSEGYWLLNYDTGTAYMLSNVVTDEYEDEYDEAEMTIIGRGRHYERGDHLGVKGNMSAQLRTDARRKKLELERIKRENLALYLRTPFGDVWEVYVGNLKISRIAGVGKSEFVDVEIPYSEVDANG